MKVVGLGVMSATVSVAAADAAAHIADTASAATIAPA
jgi:hypothetical protein